MFALFIFEIKYYFNNLREVIYFIGLFLSIILLFPFSQNVLTSNNQTLAPTILWIALATAISFNGTGLFQRDWEAGKIDLYQLSDTPIASLLFAKWVAYYGSILLPLLLLMPLAGLLLNLPPAQWLHDVLGLASGAACLSILTALLSILMLGAARAGAILGLLILPLVIPVIIFGAHYLSSPELFQPSLIFLWGFGLFLLPVYCLIGSSVIRASN